MSSVLGSNVRTTLFAPSSPIAALTIAGTAAVALASELGCWTVAGMAAGYALSGST